MNSVNLIGRLTKDPEARQAKDTTVVNFTVAVDRGGQDNGADFIRCVAYGKGGEFAEKYLRKGTKICVLGRIQTGSYTNREGVCVYTTEVVVEDHEFCEARQSQEQKPVTADGFTSVTNTIAEELPFS